jgi:hypothetical protein
MIQVHMLVCENSWIIEMHGATIKVLGSILKGQDSFENGTDSLSRNVGEKLPLLAA